MSSNRLRLTWSEKVAILKKAARSPSLSFSVVQTGKNASDTSSNTNYGRAADWALSLRLKNGASAIDVPSSARVGAACLDGQR
ncbi:uncharacterized protein PITG_19287 [Phytophthora infestans T30-4]|uniref:Uncharacterized protein n=1 Tax=Phytophthora infestans (strain T30-4) TaxID=403677 RepID=D0NZL8_PHYIT|nr:uncharacterized protein PITG_19287 [Phytophthora infestans T30-4]EEY69577.1 conserved hypothetical protein [Phytophthora infestans T30-4]|eukprot:XP_002997215.1 conserved hypothetical protein [Phytophthora infestans T30-4]